jgi:VWFA-related protein
MLRPMRNASAGVLTAIGVAAVALALHAAQDPAQPRPFQAEVNYVRVDMYPTKGGKPVTDLAAEDVEILEDNVPQKIAQFEHVSITGPRSQTASPEPSTVAGMRRAAQDPRTRLFILFIDPRHVDAQASAQVRKPLVDAINRLVGGDDLIAVMTPAMSASALTFTRRTEGIENLLQARWGEKDWPGSKDPLEFKFEACYPDLPGMSTAGIAPEMVRRYREQLTLNALDELVAHLSNIREERKAVITISEGWPLYAPNGNLARPLENIRSGLRPVVIDPRTGKPTMADPDPLNVDYATCESQRSALSQLDDERRFLGIMQSANRGNVSFYPIDPRGLSVEGQGIFSPVSSLRTMASVTDGIAIVGDLATGLQRIVDDLSSYYLMGYYSPAEPDGKFHRITVKVKRPGVDVRARSGYLAARMAPAAPVAAKPMSSADVAESQVVSEALSALSGFARERPLRLQAATAWTAGGDAGVWVVAEVPHNVSGDDWSKGGTASVSLVDESGATRASETVPLPASVGPISARVFLKPAVPLTPGEYQVRVRATSAGVLPASELVRISLAASPAVSGALFYRRNVSTGNREAATADLRFRRTERLVALLPAASAAAVSARLLDRVGKTLAIPVTVTIRDEADGSRWRAAEVTLAPLAPGDYLIELTAAGERTLSAFRVLP